MALNPSPHFNPANPIPNNPFYYPYTTYLQGPYYPSLITPSSGLTVGSDGVLTVTGGGGSVSSVTVVSPVLNTGSSTAPVIGVQDATVGQKGVVQIGANINVTGGVISVASGSTGVSGVVRLSNSLSSTSTTEALTAAQGKNLQDQINALVIGGGLTLAGTFDAGTSQMLTVTSAGATAGFAVGSNLPAPAAGNDNYFVIATTGGSYSPPGGGGPYTASQGDWFLSDGTTWEWLNVGIDLPTATTSTPGIVELATNAETALGVDSTRAVTPSALAFAYIPKSLLTAKGNIVSATAASTPATLPVGTDGQVLIACSATSTGLCWITPPAPPIPCACITAKGTLIAGSAPNTPIALPVGTNGQILVACSAAASGLCWITCAAGIPCACITAKGDLITGTAPNTPTALAVGTNGQVLAACSACSTGLTWINSVTPVSATPTVEGVVLGCTTCTATAIGCDVGTGGFTSAYFGREAGRFATGTCNTYIGRSAGKGTGVNSASNNTALGALAMPNVTTGSSNVAIGCGAASGLTVGNSNTVVGTNAGTCLIGSSSNTFIGRCAGYGSTAIGSNNVVVGVNSGLCMNSASADSIVIGNNSNNSACPCAGQIIIGHNSRGNNFQGAPNVIIGHNICPGSDRRVIIGYGGARCACFDYAADIGWTFVSDARVKGGVTALPVKAEPFINALRPVAFCYLDRQTKQPLEAKHCNIGFIAQEVERALEDNDLSEITSVVHKPESNDEYYTLTETGLTPFIVKAIQELSTKIAVLEAKLAE